MGALAGEVGPLVALGPVRLHAARAHQARRLRDRVRPGRLEAGGAGHAQGSGRQLPAPLLVQRAGDGGEPHPGRGRGDQAGPPGDAGRRGHRLLRGRRRGARGGRAHDQLQLHGHDRVPTGQRGHRRGGGLRAGPSQGGGGAQPRGEADPGRLVGAVVAQDAAARGHLVQLPAHDRLRRDVRGGPHGGGRGRPRTGSSSSSRTRRRTCPASRTRSWSTWRPRSASARRG